jgi:hypothetical protein
MSNYQGGQTLQNKKQEEYQKSDGNSISQKKVKVVVPALKGRSRDDVRTKIHLEIDQRHWIIN